MYARVIENTLQLFKHIFVIKNKKSSIQIIVLTNDVFEYLNRTTISYAASAFMKQKYSTTLGIVISWKCTMSMIQEKHKLLYLKMILNNLSWIRMIQFRMLTKSSKNMRKEQSIQILIQSPFNMPHQKLCRNGWHN